ncbi:MAG: hypothetical protein EA397_02955 [Deltaproteobacteria bacterium]|nr:MAG: hypothetical protein EA397_02955 [Deltaproteobacteria bacterium]
MNFYVFSVGRIPVHLSIWALLLIGWLAFRLGDPIVGAMIGVGAIASILVHELGHAVVAARYGLQPEVLIHALGGLTRHTRAESDRQDAIIIAAGPLIQLAVGAVVLVASFFVFAAIPGLAENLYLTSILYAFLYVSLFWGVINLAPMWPMDGGKLFRLGLIHLLSVRPLLADRITHITGIVLSVAAFLLFWLLIGGFVLLALIIFGMITYQNVMALRSGSSGEPVRPTSKHARALLNEAREAFGERNWAEAARLGHQIRAEPNVPDRMLSEVFEVIALSHIFNGDLEEGVRFAKRAPPTPRVIEAWVRAHHELGERSTARSVLDRHADALDEELRSELEQLITR